jgi:enoyl-CoA hydratase
MEMVLTGRRLSAAEALAFGLVNRVVPADKVVEAAIELANAVAARPPVAVRVAKEVVNKAFELTLSEGLAVERRNFFFLFSTEDQKEGMAAFSEKRKPEWKGR